MRRLILVISTASVMFASSAAPALVETGSDGAQVSVGSAIFLQIVSIKVSIRAGQRSIFIPVCGTQGGEEMLCPGRLEVNSEHGWQEAKPRNKDLVEGELIPAAIANGRLLAPGEARWFRYLFEQHLVAIEHGQRMRIVVKGWGDQETMKAGEPGFELTSQAFECP